MLFIHRLSLRFAMIAGLALALSGTPAWAQSGAASDIAVVVHPDTPVTDLKFSEIRRVFLGDRQYWSPNFPVVLVVRAPVAKEREVILKKIYEMSEAQFKQYWIARIFRNESASAPKVVYSSETLIELVAAIPGAISLVRFGEVGSNLKVLKVDGLLPGEAGYPLH